MKLSSRCEVLRQIIMLVIRYRLMLYYKLQINCLFQKLVKVIYGLSKIVVNFNNIYRMFYDLFATKKLNNSKSH